jgi:hypothetical protein
MGHTAWPRDIKPMKNAARSNDVAIVGIDRTLSISGKVVGLLLVTRDTWLYFVR